MKTGVLSFRLNKNVANWVAFASKAFGKGELVRLILSRSAYQQATDSPLSAWLSRLLGQGDVPDIGDTTVLAVRLSQDTASLIRECADKRRKTPSQWCALVLSDWANGFIELYETKDKHTKDGGWLTQYASKYRAEVAELRGVYAPKSQKQPSEVSS